MNHQPLSDADRALAIGQRLYVAKGALSDIRVAMATRQLTMLNERQVSDLCSVEYLCKQIRELQEEKESRNATSND